MPSTTFVPLRNASDTKERHICRLSASALETLRSYALMIEDLETKAGRPPRRRRGNDTGPEPSTMDHVLTIAINKALAKDATFVEWLKRRRGSGATNSSPTAGDVHGTRAS